MNVCRVVKVGVYVRSVGANTKAANRRKMSVIWSGLMQRKVKRANNRFVHSDTVEDEKEEEDESSVEDTAENMIR